jgi:hypothetical protein
MWLKNRRRHALLVPLAAVIDGSVAEGRATGSYGGYTVEAHPHSGFPIKYTSGPGPGRPEPVNMLHVTLAGVAGSQSWHCQSSASSALQDLASRLTVGRLLEGFKPGEFRFEGADPLNDAAERMGEKLVRALGMPIAANADPELQRRLVAGGLFEVLDALRLGHHPYLPKVWFTPGAGTLSRDAYVGSGPFAHLQPALEERLRAAGMPDYESLMAAKLAQAEREHPGRLELDVEAGRAEVPSAEQFREVLENAIRIAEINTEANRQG